MLIKAILITEYKDGKETIALSNISVFTEIPCEKIDLMLKTYGYYKEQSTYKEIKNRFGAVISSTQNILIDCFFEKKVDNIYNTLIDIIPFKYTLIK